MQVLDTALRDVKLIQPQRFGDSRGWFAEVFNQSTFSAAGLPEQFVQDNQSFSVKGVLRGLHYQLGQPQGKLVRVLSGHIWDAAVDRSILGNDPTLNITWPLDALDGILPSVSPKHARGALFTAADLPPSA